MRETGNDSPSDEDLRNKMGNVLYRIRFPTMTLKDFAELTAQSAVLTLQEKYDVHVYMAVGTKLESVKFGTKNRRGANYVANRFDRIHGEWRGIAIRTTVDIVLTGIGLYGGTKKSTHGVTLEVLRENETLSKTVTKMVSDGSRKLVKIQLENPVHVHASSTYIVAAVIIGPKTWSGEGDAIACDFGKTRTLSFGNSQKSMNCMRLTSAKIPQLFFYIP